jgi:hypothetical protein
MAVAKPHEPTDLRPWQWSHLQKVVAKRKKKLKESRRGGRVGILPIHQPEYYSPLLETPGLFLEFSKLADRGEVSREQWLGWVKTYGVLGALPEGKPVIAMRDTTTDVYSVFLEEARLASRTRRLFEAAVRKRKPDLETIVELLPEGYGNQVRDNPQRAESETLWFVEETVQRKVVEGCFPRLLKRDNYRQSRRSPLLQEWGFNSLLGAMWLQFMWWATADDMRYCEYCGSPLLNKRANARYCNRTCKQGGKRERDRVARI